VQSPDDLDKIDPIDVEKLLGEESARDLERLKELAKKLEEAGYLEARRPARAHRARVSASSATALRTSSRPQARSLGGTRSSVGRGGDPTDAAKRYDSAIPSARPQEDADERGRAQRRWHARAALADDSR